MIKKYIIVPLIISFGFLVKGINDPEQFRDIKNKENQQYFNIHYESITSSSFLIEDMSKPNQFISKNENNLDIPASLTKLFTIDFVLSKVSLDEKVIVKNEVLNLVPAKSSLAGLMIKDYTVKNLIEGMLIPSGNDAAYVLAEFIGGRLNPSLKTPKERINYFVSELNKYNKKLGYKYTTIYDPSGYDFKGRTNILDLRKVTHKLYKVDFIKEVIAKDRFKSRLPDKSFHTWKNTNLFLHKGIFYKPSVKGFKTGTLNKCNIIVIYEKASKKYLIITMGANNHDTLYKETTLLINSIN